MQALARAKDIGWIDFNNFNLEEYEYFEQVNFSNSFFCSYSIQSLYTRRKLVHCNLSITILDEKVHNLIILVVNFPKTTNKNL